MPCPRPGCPPTNREGLLTILNSSAAPATPVAPAKLVEIVRTVAQRPETWLGLLRFQSDRRWYQRLVLAEEHEVWLLSWLPGQHTGFHDHGESAGAFAVAEGELLERAAPGGRPERSGRVLSAGAVRSFHAAYVHDVRNDSARPAVSIHAYSPPLLTMRRYEAASGGGLRAAGEEREW
jgi:predicted metal-dependent enzyme (double-stranded beta helix superfamily)